MSTKQRFIPLLLWIALILTTCMPQQPKIDLKAEEEAVRAISMNWLELMKARDAAAIAALFADDGIVFSMNQEPLVGPAAIQANLAGDFAENPERVINWTTDRVDVAASGDLATEFGSWTESIPGPAGVEEDQGKYITVYRKVNGVWKVAGDMGISTKPVAGSTTAAQ
jgi:uncharacterized protein (TIGR02246 family)